MRILKYSLVALIAAVTADQTFKAFDVDRMITPNQIALTVVGAMMLFVWALMWCCYHYSLLILSNTLNFVGFICSFMADSEIERKINHRVFAFFFGLTLSGHLVADYHVIKYYIFDGDDEGSDDSLADEPIELVRMGAVNDDEDVQQQQEQQQEQEEQL